MQNAFRTLALVALAGLAGCSSIGYDDPEMVETLTIDFGSTDLQTLASSMSESMIAAPGLSFLEHRDDRTDPRIMVVMGGVENATTEHIDTKGITDSIRTRLFASGKFRFTVADQGQGEIGDQVSFQQGSGRVNPETAKAFGRQIGADVIVYGTLRSIDKIKGRSLESLGYKKEDLFYQFILNCVDIETGELLWTDEENIRKRSRSGIFGG